MKVRRNCSLFSPNFCISSLPRSFISLSLMSQSAIHLNLQNYIEETKLTILPAVCFFVFSLYDSLFRIAAAAITSCHWLRLRLPLSGFHLSQALDILVSVRSIHCCTYTPDLSTSSSLRCLTRLLYERSHLKAGFTLRCFQRLSFPNVATQLYPWRDNWYTSGSSTPVLSY